MSASNILKNQSTLDDMNRFHLPYATIILLSWVIFFQYFFCPASNNECSAAITLTSNTSCVNTAGTNVNATWNPTTFPGATVGCGAIDKSDVWYTFVAQSSTQTITISSAPAQISFTIIFRYMWIIHINCLRKYYHYTTGLTAGNTYYIRVYTQNSNTGTFNICVTHTPPANDNCAGATSLTSNTTCINTAGTLNSATASGGTSGCFGAGTYYDVWFSFVAAPYNGNSYNKWSWCKHYKSANPNIWWNLCRFNQSFCLWYYFNYSDQV